MKLNKSLIRRLGKANRIMTGLKAGWSLQLSLNTLKPGAAQFSACQKPPKRKDEEYKNDNN